MSDLRLENVVCPHCSGQHVDEGEYAERNHTRHLCEHCHRFFYVKPGNIGVEPAGPPCIGCGKPLADDSECPSACNEGCLEDAWQRLGREAEERAQKALEAGRLDPHPCHDCREVFPDREHFLGHVCPEQTTPGERA